MFKKGTYIILSEENVFNNELILIFLDKTLLEKHKSKAKPQD